MPLTIPKGENAAALADWAELLVMTGHRDGVSSTRLERMLRGEGSDDAEEEIEEAAIDPADGGELELELPDVARGEREVRVELLLDEVALRLRLGPRLYPFQHVDEQLVRRSAPGSHIYIFLLVLSSGDAAFRVDHRAHEVEAAYDEIALAALRRYLGRGARGVRFAKNAHVADDNATRPQKFREAITWLREQLELGAGVRPAPDDELEAHWQDEDQAWPQGREPLNSYSDAGVDVVIWWRFGDGRSGSPVLLAQCTVQLEWGEKVRDIDVDLWGKWIDFATVPPQIALVLPFAVNRASAQWDDRTVTAGVIIDRLRLLELLDELEEAELGSMVDQAAQEWVEQELVSLS